MSASLVGSEMCIRDRFSCVRLNCLLGGPQPRTSSIQRHMVEHRLKLHAFKLHNSQTHSKRLEVGEFWLPGAPARRILRQCFR
eukprot:3494959-Alexandrium_andersonii.AAC.1